MAHDTIANSLGEQHWHRVSDVLTYMLEGNFVCGTGELIVFWERLQDRSLT
jgi:hypothetical protein